MFSLFLRSLFPLPSTGRGEYLRLIATSSLIPPPPFKNQYIRPRFSQILRKSEIRFHGTRAFKKKTKNKKKK